MIIQHEQRLIRNKHNSSLLDPRMVKEIIDTSFAIGPQDAFDGVDMWNNRSECAQGIQQCGSSFQ